MSVIADSARNGTEQSVAASRECYFSHLINDAVPRDLELATCIYFDGIAQDFDISGMLDLVNDWFSQFGSKPRVILAGSGSGKAPRYTVKSLRLAADSDDAAVRRSFDTLEFFPRGRTTIDDTWRPSVYFAVSTGRRASVFCSVNQEIDSAELMEPLRRGEEHFRNCASYAFWFPERFSPLGYFWGMSVEPSSRRHGTWGERESRRLSHWRDNASIGIAMNDERYFFGACGGYVRDAYPLMALSETHMKRRAGACTLLERIRQDKCGEVEVVRGRYFWRVCAKKLGAAQKLLDDSDISLSGRRLEPLTSD
jgi:hypothetical protein